MGIEGVHMDMVMVGTNKLKLLKMERRHGMTWCDLMIRYVNVNVMGLWLPLSACVIASYPHPITHLHYTLPTLFYSFLFHYCLYGYMCTL